MKKAIWLTVTVVALLALTAVPAMAGGGKNRHCRQSKSFALVGEVTALHTGSKSITVMVRSGSRWMHDYIGQELTIATDASTRFLRYGDPTCESIAFGDIQEGDCVSVNGKADCNQGGDVFLAKRVTVDVPHCAQ